MKKLFSLVILMLFSSLASAVYGLECGDTINESITLTEDLLNCSSGGLIIGANDITLDCDGYSVEGDSMALIGNGIYLNQVNGITIKNCNVSIFRHGINISFGSNNTLNNNVVTKNEEGISLSSYYVFNNTAYNNIFGNIVSNNNYGIYLSSSDNNNIYNNTVSNNDGAGISLYSWSDINSIYDNTVSNNEYGIYLYNGDNNNIFGNIVNDNEDGIRLYSASNNNIYDNTASNNEEEGIKLEASNLNTIWNNNFSNNGENGIVIEFESDNNSISGNTVSYNENHGIQLFYDAKFNIISGNTIENNFDDGVELESSSDYNSIFNNIITNNNESGILFTYSSNNSISDNIITNNAEHGIYMWGFDNDIYDNLISYNEGGIRMENSDYNTIWNNNFSYNEESNAYEEDSWNNDWNLGVIGNYWSDFDSNSGSPFNYTIPGNGDGVDYYPLNEVNPYCGDTITEDTTLTEDLLNCPNHGLIIGANNITLDCDNHIINGTGGWDEIGIYLNQVNGIIVQNCNIYGFQSGINISEGSYNTLNDNVITNNGDGIGSHYTSYNNIYNNTVSNNDGYGIYISEGSYNTLNDNVITNNGDGIGPYYTSYNNIYNNTVSNNDNAGIKFYDSGNNIIFGNTVSNNNFGIYSDRYNDNNNISDNIISNNNYGIYSERYNDNNNISDNIISNNNYGIYLNRYNYYNTIWNNQFIDNGESNNQSAYEYQSYSNNWNLGEVGNNWSDFGDNSGFPTQYNIPGGGDGVDYYPVGGFSVTVISPENGSEVGLVDQVLINISPFGEVDKIWYNISDGSIVYYDGPVYVNVSDIPWNWKYEYVDGFGYVDVKRYELDVWANNTLGFMDYESVNFYEDRTVPNVNIISPVSNYSNSEVLINISAWDNIEVDRVNYTIRDTQSYHYIIDNEGYTEPVDVNLLDGEYSLIVSVNDTSGLSNYAYTYFEVDAVPDCGETINESITLTEDVLNCNEYGLIIGANNITLDCDNHIINGTGWNEYTYGIYLGNISGTTIKNCIISGFGEYGNGGAIFLSNASYNNIYQNTINHTLDDQPGSGILLHYSSTHNNILNNNIIGTGNNNYYGIYLNNDNNKNIISDNIIDNYYHGIYINGNNNSISNNQLINNQRGIYLSYADNNIIWDNIFKDNNDGNAYEGYDSNNNSWNLSDVGNDWDDFEDNPGFYDHYEIPGEGDGIDWHPFALPDLVVISINYSNLEATESTRVNVTIKNTGTEEIEGYGYVYSFNYEDRELTRESFNGRGFYPGDERTIELVYTYDLAGNYTFYFELDPDNILDEFNESDNIGLETYFIDGIPDLAASLISFEQDEYNPNLVIFNIDISNYGTIWVDDFNYNVYFGDGEGSGESISENIQPGETYPLTFTHEYPSLQEYNLLFDVYLYEMNDLNESNNFFDAIINLIDPFEGCLKGDVNLDGEIDVLDIVLLVSSILGGEELNGLQFCAGDYNDDEAINVLDIELLVNLILEGEEVTRAEIVNKIKSMLSKDRELRNELMDGVFKDVKKSKKKSKRVNKLKPVKVEEFKQVITPIEEIIKEKDIKKKIYQNIS